MIHKRRPFSSLAHGIWLSSRNLLLYHNVVLLITVKRTQTHRSRIASRVSLRVSESLQLLIVTQMRVVIQYCICHARWIHLLFVGVCVSRLIIPVVYCNLQQVNVFQ